ncbi:MAG: protein kinase [Deltaproteobacteria bacterium]|nr:protein kinase [Deltaproteobacteria bacterium]
MPPRINDLVDGRYRVLGVLGQGGAGRVYRVEDTARAGEVVALKILERTDEKWAAAFRREFEVLAAMSHPNVVRVMDFGPGPDPGTAYFTAELVVGDDIFRVTDATDVHFRLSVLTELVRALAFVHARGILHRDLKPANVLVDSRAFPGERVKLVDFGLARGATRMGKVTLFAGTPPYMAPELLEGGPPTVGTDLYALGVTAYRLFKRELPYAVKTAAALQVARSQGAPPPLPDDVSEDVAALINEMMDPDPARRPRSASAVSARLERNEALRASRPPPVLGEAPLMGRVIPLSMLKVAYEAAARGRQGGTVVLTGPAGIGRTRLISAFEDGVQLVGGRVASARCEAEGASPHVLVALARAVLAFSARSAPPASVRLLTEASRGLLPTSTAGLGALAAALDAGAEPRVLVVDDAHHAEAETLVVLSFLASQAVAPRLLVISARDDSTADWPERLRAVAQQPGVQRAFLGPLSAADGRAMAASLLGRSALPMTLLRQVDTAKGVPRLIEDAVRSLLVAGTLQAGNSGLTYVAPAPTANTNPRAPSGAPDALKDTSLDDRLLLCALALSLEPQSEATLADAFDREPHVVAISMAALENADLVHRRTGADGTTLFVPDMPAAAAGLGTNATDRLVRAVAADGTLQQAQRLAARMVIIGGGPLERVVELLTTSGLGDDGARALLAAAEERPYSRDAARLAGAAMALDRESPHFSTEERLRAQGFLDRTEAG